MLNIWDNSASVVVLLLLLLLSYGYVEIVVYEV